MSETGEQAHPTDLVVDESEQPFPWHLGVYDAHCHPTDSMASLDLVSTMKTRGVTVMATRSEDQHLVAEAAERWGRQVMRQLDPVAEGRVLPAFGWHPWFSHHLYDDEHGPAEPLTGEAKARFFHQVLRPAPDDAFIATLPDPRPLSQYLAATRVHLARYPLALVGEIGIDKSFRIPQSTAPARMEESEAALTPGAREGRPLSPYRVDVKHQAWLLTAQLHLAADLGRAVSIHGVAAHGVLLETLRATWKGHERTTASRRTRKQASMAPDEEHPEDTHQDGKPTSPTSPRRYPPRVCLHSYSGPVNVMQQYLERAIPATIFFSFSEVINFSQPGRSKAAEVIQAVPDDRILVESDLHIAGQRMDALLEAIVRRICHIKGWTLHDGVLRLRQNWQHFALGSDSDEKSRLQC